MAQKQYAPDSPILHVQCSLNPSRQTFSALLSLVLVMLLNPNVQRKAQQEIDRVVGSDRLPEFSDQPSLPYITAMCKEVLAIL